MSNIVFILGAGASHQDGAPLMNNFMDVARELYNSGSSVIRDCQEDFKMALHFYDSLDVARAKYRGDLRNIEGVLGMLEGCDILGDLSLLKWNPERSEVSLEQLRTSFTTLIVKTLEGSIEFKIDIENNRCSTSIYKEFAELVEILVAFENDVSIITTNYDLMLEVALWNTRALNITDVVSDVASANANLVREVNIYKLHGSINWYKEIGGKEVKGENICELTKKINLRNCNSTACIPFSDFLVKTEERVTPFIATPLPNKSDQLSSLGGVWRQAVQDLRKANTIIVCGYSLPESDYFFRYFYTLGMIREGAVEKLYVYDPDKEVDTRFRLLLSDDLVRRRYSYQPLKFSDAIEDMTKKNQDFR